MSVPGQRDSGPLGARGQKASPPRPFPMRFLDLAVKAVGPAEASGAGLRSG